MAKSNIFTKAKAIRKAHPRLSWQDCVKKAAGKKVSGVAVKKSPAKRVGAVKKRVASVKRKVSGTPVRKKTVVSSAKPVSRLDKGMAIVGMIGSLEKRYKTLKTKEAKQLLALEINHQHDKLDNLKKAYKKL